MTKRPVQEGEHNYSNEDLEGLYDEFLDPERPYLIVNRTLPRERREALRAEAECYRHRPPRDRLKFCYSPASYQDMDRERVRALRRCIERQRPDWVEQVRFACLMDNEVHTIVHLSGVPPYPAVAIIENMAERGELPEA